MKNRKTITIALLLSAVLLTASLASGCGYVKVDDNRAYRTYKEIKESGKIRIGVSSDNNPFGFANENGRYQGYEISFANRLAKDLGLKAEYVSTEAENRARYLEAGKVDVVISNYAIDKVSTKAVDFALPYMKTALGAVSPAKKVINSLDDLGEKDSVIVVSGSSAENYMKLNYPYIRLVKCMNEAKAIEALENGAGATWLGNNTSVTAYAYERDKYSAGIFELGNVLKIAPAVSGGNNTLRKKINSVIKSLGEETFFHTNYELTLLSTFGSSFEDVLVVEGGKI